jgi:formamidopyrimidine-DNA glycosylase
MPEVIEIRKYRDFLSKIMKNKKLKNINILKGRYITHKPFELYNELKKNLPLKVIDIKTKGKFLYILLEKDFIIFSTLGLRGGWTFCPNKVSISKCKFPKLLNYITKNKMEQYKKIAMNHLNIELVFSYGKVYYYDNLSFGTMKVVNNKKELEKKLKSLAPDIMDIDTTFEIFKERIRKTKYENKEIGIVLMDQKMISGIGNYLRSDILWLSKVSPYRKTKNLTDKELKKIYNKAKLLTWGDYNFKKGVKLGILKKTNKLPSNYNRNFFVYSQEIDLYGNSVLKEPLFEGKEKRFIYWSPKRQK